MSADLCVLTICRPDAVDEAQRRHEELCPRLGLSLSVIVPSETYLESALDDALKLVLTPYVFRLDDDEWPSAALQAWIAAAKYREADHWKFPRLHLWPDGLVILNPPLWPDWQTRLSTVEKAGGRGVMHAGSPYGGGRPCPLPILHEKFLKPYAERRAIAESYEAVMEGAGLGSFKPFHLPEEVWPEEERLLLLVADPYGTAPRRR